MNLKYTAVAETDEGEHEFSGTFPGHPDEDVRDLFDVARKAAFEHGESLGHARETVTVTAINYIR